MSMQHIGDGQIIETTIGARSALGQSVAACTLVVFLSFICSSPAVAQLPPIYNRCANVEVNPSAAIAACSAIIQSGRESDRNLAVSYMHPHTHKRSLRLAWPLVGYNQSRE